MTDARPTPPRPAPRPPAPRAPAPDAPRGAFARARAYVTQRVDPLTSMFLVIPLFLVYQLGVLVQMDCGEQGCRWAGNGVDFLTSNLLSLTHGSRLMYAGIALVTAVALTGGVLWARRRAQLRPRLFVPVLIESALWASIVGPLVIALQRAISLGAPGSTSFFGDVIASCGAGLHEELIFRAGLFAGGAWLLKRLKVAPWLALVASAVVSSVVFSAIHYVGSLGDTFTISSFVFRALAGMIFATLYQTRGFAIAAWTHAMYDVWIFAGQRLH